MLRATLRLLPPVSSQASDGRTPSAPTTASRELVISSRRAEEYFPARSGHCAGPCAQASPATSAPAPGWSSSQSNSRQSPRRRSGRAEHAGATSSEEPDMASCKPSADRGPPPKVFGTQDILPTGSAGSVVSSLDGEDNR